MGPVGLLTSIHRRFSDASYDFPTMAIYDGGKQAKLKPSIRTCPVRTEGRSGIQGTPMDDERPRSIACVLRLWQTRNDGRLV